MDHKGRCFDNIHIERLWRTIKQEAIYYYKPESIADLEKILNLLSGITMRDDINLSIIKD